MPQQQCCQDARQISAQLEYSNHWSRSFKDLHNIIIRLLMWSWYWIAFLGTWYNWRAMGELTNKVISLHWNTKTSTVKTHVRFKSGIINYLVYIYKTKHSHDQFPGFPYHLRFNVLFWNKHILTLKSISIEYWFNFASLIMTQHLFTMACHWIGNLCFTAAEKIILVGNGCK